MLICQCKTIFINAGVLLDLNKMLGRHPALRLQPLKLGRDGHHGSILQKLRLAFDCCICFIGEHTFDIDNYYCNSAWDGAFETQHFYFLGLQDISV